MDERTRLLVSIGASLAANCAPCLEHYLAQARRVGLSKTEVREAMEVGDKIQRGARIAMQARTSELADQFRYDAAHRAK